MPRDSQLSEFEHPDVLTRLEAESSSAAEHFHAGFAAARRTGLRRALFVTVLMVLAAAGVTALASWAVGAPVREVSP